MLYSFLVANQVQFVIKPTKNEGVDFGMKWRLGLFRLRSRANYTLDLAICVIL